ncbi:hypothetical protein [Halopelagius longus]|uniref:Uncharacterized protein n=1 Tax=Halopelagius longus TaxID=1236180 RepID=A0A1H0XXM6_9EURY|nr:hypothetical protein [Halopelagius longus]RDI72158.1 hypothetical protein DWB78_10780 [Halopelagius longus]SDQ07648.1 hypothetical protein SAMN05216278_0264 [Halopelagius longus]
MVTVLDFVVMLLRSAVELLVTGGQRIIGTGDPLTIISFLVGGVLIAFSVAFFGYLAVGGLVNWATGLGASAPSRTPRPRE